MADAPDRIAAALERPAWLTVRDILGLYPIGRTTVYALLASDWAPFVSRVGRKVLLRRHCRCHHADSVLTDSDTCLYWFLSVAVTGGGEPDPTPLRRPAALSARVSSSETGADGA